jgi:hypothetical protein
MFHVEHWIFATENPTQAFDVPRGTSKRHKMFLAKLDLQKLLCYNKIKLKNNDLNDIHK